MKIDTLRKAAAALNSKLAESARGQSLAFVNTTKAQIEFNNAALAAITELQQQMEMFAGALKDQQASRPS